MTPPWYTYGKGDWSDPGYLYAHRAYGASSEDLTARIDAALAAAHAQDPTACPHPSVAAFGFQWKPLREVMGRCTRVDPGAVRACAALPDFSPFSPRARALLARQAGGQPAGPNGYPEAPVSDIFAVRQVPADWAGLTDEAKKLRVGAGKDVPRWIICLGAQRSGDHGRGLLLTYASRHRGDAVWQVEGNVTKQVYLTVPEDPTDRIQYWNRIEEELDTWFRAADGRNPGQAWADELVNPVGPLAASTKVYL
ncbi:MAG TPA: hypothetical protein VFF65_06165 [Phycisphaerales bacterium]|nr:hypothetical protein [Phycisphaerales bacterium]